VELTSESNTSLIEYVSAVKRRNLSYLCWISPYTYAKSKAKHSQRRSRNASLTTQTSDPNRTRSYQLYNIIRLYRGLSLYSICCYLYFWFRYFTPKKRAINRDLAPISRLRFLVIIQPDTPG